MIHCHNCDVDVPSYAPTVEGRVAGKVQYCPLCGRRVHG